MSRFNFDVVVLLCTLTVASTVFTARAETAPSAQVVAAASLDKQKLKSELAELEAEVERVRRTQGEPGLRRSGLKQKLAREKSMVEFHLLLIDRLERIEQRLAAIEARTGGR